MDFVHHWIELFFQYFRQNPNMGALFAFIVAFSESLPIIGTIVPGSVTMTAIGVLIGRGILPVYSTFAWAILGAFAGDTIGFWLGHYFKDRLHRMWPFTRWPQILTGGEKFFARHGGKSILIGRFVGPARSAIPMVAGLLQLSWLRFFAAAIPSAILWALVYTVPGILLGALSLEIPPAATTEFILVGLVILLLIWLVLWLIMHFFKQLALFINRGIDRWWDWLNRHHSSKWLIRYITNQQRPQDHHQLTLVCLSVLSLALFLFVFVNVAAHTWLIAANAPIFHLLQSLRSTKIDNVLVFITMLGNPRVLLVAGFVIALGLLFAKQYRAGLHLIALIFLAAVIVGLTKQFYFNPRPLPVSKSSSFPSGHVTLSFVLSGFIAFYFCQWLALKRHWIVYTLATLFVFLIALSRMMLGAHWLTDVLGSLSLGFFLLLGVIAHFRRMPKKPTPLKSPLLIWSIIVAIGLLVPWSAYLATRYHQKRLRYTPKSVVQTLTMQQWWNETKQHAPLYRNNRFGNPLQPFNLQWLTPLATIKQYFVQHGWHVVTDATKLKRAVKGLSSAQPLYHLPLLPWQYKGEAPVLLMIKKIPGTKSIFEVRFWRSFIHIKGMTTPLWLGAVNRHQPNNQILSLHKRRIISFYVKNAMTRLQNNLPDYQIKIITIPEAQQPRLVKRTGWSGQILLIRPAK